MGEKDLSDYRFSAKKPEGTGSKKVTIRLSEAKWKRVITEPTLTAVQTGTIPISDSAHRAVFELAHASGLAPNLEDRVLSVLSKRQVRKMMRAATKGRTVVIKPKKSGGFT